METLFKDIHMVFAFSEAACFATALVILRLARRKYRDLTLINAALSRRR